METVEFFFVCEHEFRIWILNSVDKVWDASLDVTYSIWGRESRVRNVSSVMSLASKFSMSIWNGVESLISMDVWLISRLWEMSLNFFGKPRKNIRLHLSSILAKIPYTSFFQFFLERKGLCFQFLFCYNLSVNLCAICTFWWKKMFWLDKYKRRPINSKIFMMSKKPVWSFFI